MKGKKSARRIEQTQHLRIRNSRGKPLRMHIEPWGDELEMVPGAVYEIAAQGPAGDCLDVDLLDGEVSIYGWAGSILLLYQEQKLLREYTIPPPATPPRQH